MLGRIVACRRGAVSVEAALLMPALILLVIGAMEFGLLIFTYSAMQTATREAARELAVNFATAGSVAGAVRARLPQWSQAAATVEVSQSAPGNAAANVITVRVDMRADEATPVRIFTRLADEWGLRTEVVMKQELPL
ncbi:TadE/TadG family type IV pilus assembly protein [Amaricoccus sp.]|uniref:TadE/TadG family type IV pilus assembly protein n=1 Tax=Amaricoccus sp. TaxID=1872485 RepID=UPI001B41E3DA|nr:TadE/TadG family type IV pilus assembly protein [Amaricoccus sp.]MBP7242530.1 pilus assembly protein [Amaricoccus sp.]